jgi:hypothetical protein
MAAQLHNPDDWRSDQEIRQNDNERKNSSSPTAENFVLSTSENLKEDGLDDPHECDADQKRREKIIRENEAEREKGNERGHMPN